MRLSILKFWLKIGLSVLSLLLYPILSKAELRQFEMTVEELVLEIAPGFKSKVWAYNGQAPGPLIHVNVPEHVGLRGMWGPFIVEPKEPLPIEQEVTKEAIIMFSSWNSKVANEFGDGGHPTEKHDYYSMNGKSFPMTQPLRVKEGDVVRFRLYGSETAFHLHDHDMLVMKMACH